MQCLIFIIVAFYKKGCRLNSSLNTNLLYPLVSCACLFTVLTCGDVGGSAFCASTVVHSFQQLKVWRSTVDVWLLNSGTLHSDQNPLAGKSDCRACEPGARACQASFLIGDLMVSRCSRMDAGCPFPACVKESASMIIYANSLIPNTGLRRAKALCQSPLSDARRPEWCWDCAAFRGTSKWSHQR